MPTGVGTTVAGQSGCFDQGPHRLLQTVQPRQARLVISIQSMLSKQGRTGVRSSDTACCFVLCLQRWLAELMSRAHLCCTLMRVWCSHARDPSLVSRRTRAGRGRTGGPFSRTLLAPGPCFGGRVVTVGLFFPSRLFPSVLRAVFPPAWLSTSAGSSRHELWHATSYYLPANGKPLSLPPSLSLEMIKLTKKKKPNE